MEYENQTPSLEDRPAPSAGPSFADILSEFEQSHRRDRDGQARQGTVVAVSSEAVFVDIGLKTEGLLPASQVREELKPGDQIAVSISGRSPEGYYELSLVKAARPKDWSSLERAFQEKQGIAAVVSGVVKGGLSVDVGVRAFLPASRSGAKEQAELEKLVGQEILCKIIELDVAKEDVVVDRRVVLEEEEAEARERALGELQEGAVVRGTVRSLTDYGAFVDLGGFDGLLHVADISWKRVAKPADVLSAGEQVEVKVLKIDRESRRISLGMKQLSPDPWSQAAEKYPVGSRVRGTVSRVAEFGAFVELEPGLEGLIHLSELSWSKRVRKPSDVVKPPESVEVVVLSVNPEERRVGLGLKQALGDPWESAEERFPVGAVVEGTINNLAKFGAFVELAQGVEGMIHIADIPAEKRLNHPQEVLKVGQKVRAQVLGLDRERRRIRLGMKQLQPTSGDEYISEHKPADRVTGRIVEIQNGLAKVELGEGIHGTCRIPAESSDEPQAPASSDLQSLTALLEAKWKRGKAPAGRPEPVRAGQIRNFRIVSLDPRTKTIEVELTA